MRHRWGTKVGMQWVRALTDSDATSILMSPRIPKRLGISSRSAHHHLRHERRSDATFNGHRKTRITVHALDPLAPVYKSVMLVVPMHAYESVPGLPWFHKSHPDIDCARLTPCDHRVRMEQRKWHWWLRRWHRRCQKPNMLMLRQASGVWCGYTNNWSNRIRGSSKLEWSSCSICPSGWGMHRTAGSDIGTHHSGFTRSGYRPKCWKRRAESSGVSCRRTAPPRRDFNDCCRIAETRPEWLDSVAVLLCMRKVNEKASWLFPSTASMPSWFFI